MLRICWNCGHPVGESFNGVEPCKCRSPNVNEKEILSRIARNYRLKAERRVRPSDAWYFQRVVDAASETRKYIEEIEWAERMGMLPRRRSPT